jgi:hypothetical protein
VHSPEFDGHICKSSLAGADRASARRSGIVAVALQVFLENGYSGASLSLGLTPTRPIRRKWPPASIRR